MYGISIYPNKEKREDTLAYIKLAAELGYKRIFSSLLFDESPTEEEIEQFRAPLKFARELGFEVVLDVNPTTYTALGISETDLTFFKELGATGVRLDTNFDGLVESIMSFDRSGVDIELNIANDTGVIENILSYQSNRRRLIGCHNFYPQRYTGMDTEYFLKCSKKYKGLGFRTAAFVSSQVAKICPFEYNDGLPTLEEHRDWDIVTQAKHMVATGLIDDIIISNSFASEQELRDLIALDESCITFNLELNESATDVEKEIAFENLHFRRGDINSYSIRSTFVKLKYQKIADIPKGYAPKMLRRGDVTIGNNDFAQYKAELKIVLKDMENIDGMQNVIGRIPEREEFMLEYLNPWTKFISVEDKN